MHSETLWKSAQDPNYSTNVDLSFPYSQLPYLGEFKLTKIPLSPDDLIKHVDYWGEERVVAPQGVSGFTNCYNVNLPYRLVSNGADRDRKIANRIPIPSYDNCDTSKYIRDNSVMMITIIGAGISTSCAEDVARIINKDLGKVIVYGHQTSSKDISNLTAALKKKLIFQCSQYPLPDSLEHITLFNEHIVFLNINVNKDEVTRLVTNGAYKEAVALAKDIYEGDNGAAIKKLLEKYLNNQSSDNNKLMSFGYQLWINGGKNVVSKIFPKEIKLIFEGALMKIVNKGYNQPLKLDVRMDGDNDRPAWGDGTNADANRLSWRFYPVWVDNTVIFKVYNTDCNAYLKSAIGTDSMGDRRVYGSKQSDTYRHKFILEPYTKNGVLEFYIINYEYRQGLKLSVARDGYGDRLLYGHNGDMRANEDRYRWIIQKL